MIGLVISLSGVIYFLLALCVLALLVWGVRYVLTLMGVTLPQPLWAILGFMLVLIVLLWFLGIIGGGPGTVSIR